MAKKTFQEVFDEIQNNIAVTKSGKQIKSFSRSDFNALSKAYLNEHNYKTEIVSVKGGETVKTEVFPVKEFRGMLKKILVDFGVDKVEAERIIDTYEITNVDGLYEICSELIYNYINAGKKFDFLRKFDFNGGVSLRKLGVTVETFSDIKGGGKGKIEKQAHKILMKNSKCPKYLKKRIG